MQATVAFEVTDDCVLAKILKPEGTADVAVGEIIAITVDSPKDVAAFASYVDPAAAAAAPAAAAPKAAAPAPAAPAPAPAPAPTSAPAPAAPKAAAAAPAPRAAAPAAAPAPPPAAAASKGGPQSPAAAASEGYLAYEAWGTTLQHTPVGLMLAAQQAAYIDAYGYTGFDPLPVPAPPAKGEKGGDKAK